MELEKKERNLKKPLDKLPRMCYNKYSQENRTQRKGARKKIKKVQKTS